MNIFQKTQVIGALLLFGAAGCADLQVDNPNAPDAGRALETAGDIESLIAGSYKNWYIANGAYSGISMALGNMAFEYGSSAANSGSVFYSSFPRPEIVNAPTGSYYPNFEWVYTRSYRSISAAASGIAALEDPAIAAALDDIEAGSVLRARAYGKFVLGLSHATVAVLFDKGFIVDETTELIDAAGQPVAQEAVPYTQMMDAALGYFDEAIALAGQGDFVIPGTWMTTEVTNEELVQIAHSMKARYRAAVARTPAEREAVDWDAVLADISAGVTDSYLTDLEYVYSNWLGNVSHLYTSQPGSWAFPMYWIEGMADQDGQYQEWLATPVNDRHPNLDSGPFLINTPDTRFPQGSTVEEQAANPGEYYKIPVNSSGVPSLTGQWARPDRGTWRWSYYDDANARAHNAWLWGVSDLIPEISIEQQRLLAAEAHYRNGDLGEAATLINVTRTEHGLNATDAAGTNTSCVPRLPNEQCGDLFEMLKWEKRMEGRLLGILQAEGFFDSRGWGDLYLGTALHFPIPGLELQTLQLPAYTFGGVGGEAASAGSSYNYPHESP